MFAPLCSRKVLKLTPFILFNLEDFGTSWFAFALFQKAFG